MNVLAEILEKRRERLEETRREIPEKAVRAEAEDAPDPPSFRAAVEREGTTLIAETKRRSPSRGVLREPYDPVGLAKTYEMAGARAISVLTEPDFFGGSAADLRRVSAVTRLPVLRKDFLFAPYQCWEARACGAAAALLIVAALDDAQLRDLHGLLGELGLEALIEVHTESEAERALDAGVKILGVNNRNLETFETKRSTTAQIARYLPGGTLLVSESGIATREHVLEVEAAGASAVLVGEALVTAEDPAQRARELVGGGRP